MEWCSNITIITHMDKYMIHNNFERRLHVTVCTENLGLVVQNVIKLTQC